MEHVDILDILSHLLMYLAVLLMSISAHEAAHAWMSKQYGDNTAFLLGRVTLNPVAHTDPIGTLLIPAAGFLLGAFGGSLGRIPLIGWGKPTPVNPRNWTNYKMANVMVSIAGILANLTLAIIAFSIIKTLQKTGNYEDSSAILEAFKILLQYMLYMNVSLAIFNLLPFPPLDGSKVLETFLPPSAQPMLEMLEQNGYVILMGLMYFGVIRAIMQPVFALLEVLLRL